MVCARFTNLFLGLLFSWLALCDSKSIAQIESANEIRDNQYNLEVKDIQMTKKMKLITGRKMRIVLNKNSMVSVAKCVHEGHLNKECKMRVVTGEANKPPNMQVVESNKIKKDEQMKGNKLESVEFSETEELKEAENAIYSMMTRDYNLKARAKPPSMETAPAGVDTELE